MYTKPLAMAGDENRNPPIRYDQIKEPSNAFKANKKLSTDPQ